MDIKEFQEETTSEAFDTGLTENMSCTYTCHWGHHTNLQTENIDLLQYDCSNGIIQLDYV